MKPAKAILTLVGLVAAMSAMSARPATAQCTEKCVFLVYEGGYGHGCVGGMQGNNCEAGVNYCIIYTTGCNDTEEDEDDAAALAVSSRGFNVALDGVLLHGTRACHGSRLVVVPASSVTYVLQEPARKTAGE